MSLEMLKKIGERICEIPSNFNIHPRLSHVLNERLEMIRGVKSLDWGMAETLAYASLLSEGFHVRLSGQDSRRGTFSHRHAMWIDQKNSTKYFPLNHIKTGQGRFDVFNSPLSEYAVLGFEFGYSVILQNALVIWEAQFGDFCNGAQIVIDQFIATAEQKWGAKSGVTLFLPHGYEGQGPEHSSGRMERFLALCGNDNMRIANPTTPAQLFHLLRRQVLFPIKKPLIIFTPKGLLRHPECVSPLSDLEQGQFQEILFECDFPKHPDKVVFCSGRIYYDLVKEYKERKLKIAIVRIEQLYPLNISRIQEKMNSYKNVKEWIWAQEEPSNMGAWSFIRPHLQGIAPKEVSLRYVGREASASPAAGSYALHKKEYSSLMEQIFIK